MNEPTSLPREEHIEQEYFFRVYRERLEDNIPSQEILKTVHEEILSTTRLPMAIEFLCAEIHHAGRISDGMSRLGHYFRPFQTFVISRAEDEVSKFEQVTALKVLELEAGYLAKGSSMAGMFVYQFECITRNRLGFGDGLKAMASDPIYNEPWKKWIRSLTSYLGAAELSELVYRASEHYRSRRSSLSAPGAAADPSEPPALFGEQDGRIAKANIGRDPLYFFAALQRQLNYPKVPLSRKVSEEKLPPAVEARISKIEQRLRIAEMELKGGIDLTRFYKKPPDGNQPPDFSDAPGLPD